LARRRSASNCNASQLPHFLVFCFFSSVFLQLYVFSFIHVFSISSCKDAIFSINYSILNLTHGGFLGRLIVGLPQLRKKIKRDRVSCLSMALTSDKDAHNEHSERSIITVRVGNEDVAFDTVSADAATLTSSTAVDT